MTIGATLTERLAIIVDARTDGAVTNIRKLSLEEQAAAERATALQAKITDLEASMSRSRTPGGTAAQQQRLSRLSNEYKGLTSNLANVPAAASRAESALAKVGLGGLVPSSTLAAAGKALPGLAAGALAFGEFDFLKSGVQDYLHLADAIRKVAQASGASAPEASRVVAITHALGVESDTAALGLFRLGKNIDLQPARLTAYGIAIARTSNGNTDLVGTLLNVASAYQGTQDPARKAAIVYEAFGRAGTTMLPILNANRQQLEEISKEAAKQGRIFNQADLDKARAYQIETRELQTAWQSLAITAGKSLVPALTDVAGVLTKVGDLTHSTAFNVGKWIIPGYQVFRAAKFGLHLVGLGGSGGPSAEQTATQQLADAQAQAEQQALAQQAQSTLAGAFDQLAGPQTLKQAQQTLAQAQGALTNARASRAKALRDLASTRAGGPSAGAAQIEAANARVTAAEAALRTAQYLGGDQRISSAKASLLSAQAGLNRLRQSGATDTNRLADAEDRLRRANKAVADQQHKVADAQKGVNRATGLTADQVLGRVTHQADDQSKLAAANIKLASRGLSTEVIGNLDKLNQQLPGTLVKVAHTINAGIVARLNQQQGSLDFAQQQFAAAASNPDLFAKAGAKAGNSYVKSFNQVLTDGLPFTGPLPKGARRPTGPAPTLGGLLTPPGVTVHGNIIVKGKSARQVAKDIAHKSRMRALSSGSGEQHYGWDD